MATPALVLSRAEWAHCCMERSPPECAVPHDGRASKGPFILRRFLITKVKSVQVLGLVKDVQAKSGKLYKDWLRCAFHP